MTGEQHQVCLLLGSNIRAEQNLPLAVDLLQQEVTILQISSIWETPSVGASGPNFLNAALLASTPLETEQFKLRVLRPLEARMGRVRSGDKNAARTIDLDIILFDGRLMDASLWQLAHRAVPVAEIFPDLESAQGEKLKETAARLSLAAPIRLRSDVPLQPHQQEQ
jgi:2-amino-4-hydroxy-6-hydroxymethyldihydropteridine diphosphokinase